MTTLLEVTITCLITLLFHEITITFASHEYMANAIKQRVEALYNTDWKVNDFFVRNKCLWKTRNIFTVMAHHAQNQSFNTFCQIAARHFPQQMGILLEN